MTIKKYILFLLGDEHPVQMILASRASMMASQFNSTIEVWGNSSPPAIHLHEFCIKYI